jgi:hypothetical protein
MTVSLSQLISDWLPTAGWIRLRVVDNSIRPGRAMSHIYIGSNLYVTIADDSVAGISASDPEFFAKLDQYLLRKYFSNAAWYQDKFKKARHQIWP